MGEKMAALFRQISYGVYVIGVTDGERRNAFADRHGERSEGG